MEIHAREFGEVLNVGVRLLIHVWRRLIPPAFGAFVLLGAVTIAVFMATDGTVLLDLVLNNPEGLNTIPEEEARRLLQDLLLATSISLVGQFVASTFVSLAAYRLAGSQLAGTDVTAGSASSFAMRRTLPLLGAYLLVILGTLVGLVLFIFPGVWLAGSWTMTGPALALEDRRPVESLGRSFRLVQGRWWRTVGFMVLVGLLGSVAAQLVQLLAIPLLILGGVGIGAGLAFALTFVAQGFIVGAIAVMATAWYVDLRARRETVLSESLG